MEDAKLLNEQDRRRGASILSALVEEECAKYLILLDAIRCPRKTDEHKTWLSAHLWRFYDHFANRIYAEYYGLSLACFGEGRRYIEGSLDEFYLDGPEGIEWVFRNRWLQAREDELNVNLVEDEDGLHWQNPRYLDFFQPLPTIGIGPFSIVQCFQEVGFADARALVQEATIWRAEESRKDFGRL